MRLLPGLMNHALGLARDVARIAEELAEAQDVLFLGRGAMFPLALEGALKLKEISYIHAEGYASGELKHGPIALIDARVPVIVLAPRDALFDKTVSNMQEVMARHGKVLLISDAHGMAEAGARRLAHPDPARGGADLRPDPLCHPGAAAGLSHRHRQGHRCGPAAQPRQIGDGGMIAAALAQLEALADPAKAAEAAPITRPTAAIWACRCRRSRRWSPKWRADATLDDRIALAAGLWDTDIHEARVAAAKLLTQARIRPDDAVWDWCEPGCRSSTPGRWPIMPRGRSRAAWSPTRRASTRSKAGPPPQHVDPPRGAGRDPALDQAEPPQTRRDSRPATGCWAGRRAWPEDRDWFIQKAVAWWLRDLSKHDPDRARAFLAAHGDRDEGLCPERGRTASVGCRPCDASALVPGLLVSLNIGNVWARRADRPRQQPSHGRACDHRNRLPLPARDPYLCTS